MDPALEIRAERRSAGDGVDADATPIALAWHALRRWEKQRASQRGALEAAWSSARPAWIALADECHRLDGLAHRLRPVLEEAGEVEALKALDVMVSRLRKRLEDGGVQCLCPEGEPFTPEVGEIFESVAQKPCPETNIPVVLDVIEPAVLMHGALIREGKAVIGVPAEEERS